MESLILMSIVSILREAFKIFTKNGKIFAYIALITLFINSIQYFSNFYSIKPLLADLMMESILLHMNNITNPQINPQSTNVNSLSHITKDLKMLIGLELIYFTINTLFFLLTTTATILAAALIHGGQSNDFSFKNLVSIRTVKSWLRVLSTWFYTFLFCVLLIFVFGFVLGVTSLIFTDHFHLLLASIPLGFLALILYIYLSVTWNLAIVISAVEKTKGMEAIRKAGEILKGMRLKGFLINVLLSLMAVVLYTGVQLLGPAKSQSVMLFKGVVVVYISSLVKMYCFAAFTVMYYMCKKNHGESVELEGSSSSPSGYAMVPTFITPVVDDQLP